MFSFWNRNCHKINFNFPTNQKCLSYFNLIRSFVVIFVIAWGSTYSLSKFSRLHYKSFKSLDHNVHSVWHVKRGNMNITPQGEMSNCWSGETSFNHKLRKFTELPGTWAQTPPPPLSTAKYLSLSVLLGKTTWLSLALENSAMEVTTRNSSLSHKNLTRIQTPRCVLWFSCYYKALDRACGPESRVLLWEGEAGGRGKSQHSPCRPQFFSLLKLRSSGFMAGWNIAP